MGPTYAVSIFDVTGAALNHAPEAVSPRHIMLLVFIADRPVHD